MSLTTPTEWPSAGSRQLTQGDCLVRAIDLLLIEDSPHDVELILAVLERAGYRVDACVAHDRQGTVAALASRRFDLIVSDYVLPGFSGVEALQIARAAARQTPFLFLSGVYGEEHAVEVMRLGAVDYVLKQNLSLLPKAIGRALAEVDERRERQRIADELQRAEVRARLAIDAANQGMWDYEPHTGKLIWDSRCKAMFGLDEDAAVDLALFEARIHPDDRPAVMRAVRRAVSPSEEGAYGVEFRVRGERGRVRWLASRGRAFFENGICTRFLGVISDITEQRRAAAALERLNATLGARVERRTRERNRTWELSRDLLGILGPDTVPEALNPAWEVALCWPRGELLQAPLLSRVHPDDQAAAQAEFERLLGGRVSTRFVCRLRHADGSYRSISWGAVPDEGRLYLVGRDITSEIAIIEELAEANRQLRQQIEERERVEATLQQMQRLEAVGQLTAGVAHDFNNLLTIVLINATFLGRELQKAGAAEGLLGRLQNIREAGERGARLTNQLLAFSRRQQLTPEPVDLNDTVTGMLDLLRSTLGGSVWVETRTCADLWHALVDPTQIELIVLNLAINARDAMGAGGTLRLITGNEQVRRAPVKMENPEPGDYVVLTVEDTGSGMPEAVLAKAFEPFFTTKDIGKGSGLGLAQVFGFAKQSGGGVSIDTELGVGTRVKVYLPRAAAPGPVAVVGDVPHAEAPGGAPKGRVLVVDDDVQVREVTGAMLGQLGYQVVMVDSGPNAMLHLEQSADIDLLLADFAMPGMNGGELLSLVNARFPELPVVFVTGYAELGRLDAEQTPIVQKPFTERMLDQALRQALGHKARYAGPS